jgi:transmembrane sensor
LTLEDTFNHIDDLIGKYLARETSAEEKAAVESWLSQSEGNRKYFDQFKTIFERAAIVKELQHFDADTAWNKVRSRLYEKTGAKTTTMTPPSAFNLFLRIAASIVIILGIGFFTYRFINPGTTSPHEVATEKNAAADTLPDGSDVFLNKKTKLAYSFDRKKKTHIVKLQGEAYFNVHHDDDDKSFIVEVEGAFIRDIGTSFNVKAYPESNTVEVAVEEGEVMFYTEKSTGISLRAGGKGIYHKTTGEFTVEEAEPNVTAYKTRFFIFSGTDLASVVQNLNNVYDQQIVIGNHLRSCRLTVSFNNEDINEIANVIAETLGLTVKVSGQNIVLEGKGCGN